MTPKEIAELRQRLGVSMEKFGKILHVSHATISKWESGETEPRYAYQMMLDKLKTVVDEQETREGQMKLNEFRKNKVQEEARKVGVLFVKINERIEKLEKQKAKLIQDLRVLIVGAERMESQPLILGIKDLIKKIQ